jgi:hypothetical protein
LGARAVTYTVFVVMLLASMMLAAPPGAFGLLLWLHLVVTDIRRQRSRTLATNVVAPVAVRIR